ncbi:hypothetical protein JAAARDRAFT_201162 [Jaapia argillacea MUCL 33604]|uniref:Uncharacterized protein n=1 Tax=Jaapia argillacea MUCL 33604 TaxID=933084 RepID=A0A067PF13_9AGAM|nr:hypothetical protein JAAARDRAFT_201162 [Jaapia argillacea MUCL 33604]
MAAPYYYCFFRRSSLKHMYLCHLQSSISDSPQYQHIYEDPKPIIDRLNSCINAGFLTGVDITEIAMMLLPDPSIYGLSDRAPSSQRVRGIYMLNNLTTHPHTYSTGSRCLLAVPFLLHSTVSNATCDLAMYMWMMCKKLCKTTHTSALHSFMFIMWHNTIMGNPDINYWPLSLASYHVTIPVPVFTMPLRPFDIDEWALLIELAALGAQILSQV